MSFLSLSRVEKTYPDGTQAVKGVDLDIEEGEFVVLLGPSGCGKTTTLRMIAGLELATAGTIRLSGRDVTSLRPSQRDVGMVFQFYALYPHLTVRENIEFPLRSVGMNRAEVKQRVDRVAEEMGLTGLLKSFPRQLSGGDQQKVSLARAIVREPSVYLMDEPLGTLDSDQKLKLREFIRTRQLELKVTTIYVTHDQEEAMSLADRMVVMEGGKIRQAGTPAEIYDRPRDLFVARFVGSPGMNIVDGELRSEGSRSLFVSRAGAHVEVKTRLESGPVTLGIRSEHVHVDPAGELSGKVVTDEYLGAYRNLHADSGLGRLVLRGDAERPFHYGEEVRFRLDPMQVVLFDERGLAA
jgi:multiple sugar transport system ATP-binding protein